MRIALLQLLPIVLLVVVGCGRSAEPIVACPQPSAECEELLDQQRDLELIYANAAKPDVADGVTMDESSQCVQVFVEQSLDLQCVKGCDELCRLHPCVIVDDDGGRFDPSTCVARCEFLVERGDVAAADLDEATVKAGENPGFCSCRACTAEDDALCTKLFDCAI
ncbi:MAG: hypothetical protein Q8O67_08770 [Deltaproteobacteria bacterium]|nr:hypothetical protein [Deltaproteobacteria bacterium]